MIRWLINHIVSTLVVALLVAICVIIYLVIKLSQPPSNEPIVVVPNKPIADFVEHPELLERFQADWDIYDRFETWPATLPLAQMCEISYDGLEDAQKHYRELGFSNVAIIHSPLHSQCCYLVSEGDVLVIVFRGTNDTEDWIQNLNQYHHNTDDGAVHAGFAICYSVLRQQLIEQVAAANAKHIWISGHSLGGALALICAYDLEKYTDSRVDGIFTFGQPMVGRDEFAAYIQNNFGTRYVHFVNELDGVPRLPVNFSHCGLLVWFDRGVVKKSKRYARLIAAANPIQTQDSSPEIFVNELPTMPVNEFQKLQEQLRAQEMLMFPNDELLPESTNNTTKIPEEWEMVFDDLKKTDEERKELLQKLGVFDSGKPGEIPFEVRRYSKGRRMAAMNLNLPWEKDHNMSEYIKKIEMAIEKARQGNEP